MAKRLGIWFVSFGLSFLFSKVFYLFDQGKAFLFFYFLLSALVCCFVVSAASIVGRGIGHGDIAARVSVKLIITTIFDTVISLFISWFAAKIFNVDFYVAYQIFTLGECMCINNLKKQD